MEKKIKSVTLKEIPLIDCDNVYSASVTYSKSYVEAHPEEFEIEYEPERKFIDVRIEYSAKDNPLSRLAVENILAALNKHYEGFILENLTVTELNQGWTDEDMIEFVKYYMSFNRDLTVEEELEQFKAERKSK